jgi:hypothetical protein
MNKTIPVDIRLFKQSEHPQGASVILTTPALILPIEEAECSLPRTFTHFVKADVPSELLVKPDEALIYRLYVDFDPDIVDQIEMDSATLNGLPVEMLHSTSFEAFRFVTNLLYGKSYTAGSVCRIRIACCLDRS